MDSSLVTVRFTPTISVMDFTWTNINDELFSIGSNSGTSALVFLRRHQEQFKIDFWQHMHEIKGNKDYRQMGREGRKRTRKEEIQAHQIHACLQV
jgi:hypothetical protein